MITGIVVLVLLILLSAFFSGTESAFVSLSEIDLIDISNSERKTSKSLTKLFENKERLLSTILIGNNLVNISAAILNTILAIHYSSRSGISEELTVALSSVGLVIMILGFGEIIPKSIAIYHNRRICLLTAPVILTLSIVLYPVNYFYEKVGRFSDLLYKNKKNQHRISQETVINVVSKSEELGVINESEKELIQNVFLFDEREVYSVMTPRTAVFALRDSLTLKEAQKDLLSKQFSRIPVYSDSIDNITGIINLKTVFTDLLAGHDTKKLIELAQKPLFVYETLSVTALLEKFKSEQNHMVIVVDEFGGMAGIVTLEDIIEELVGEIYDEKDEGSSLIRKHGDAEWIISGRIDIMTINKYISGEIAMDGEFESLQGLIMSKLDRLPVKGDMLFVEPHSFTVLKMKQNEILSVLVEYKPKNSSEEKHKDD
ncbi:hemolysin family protein [bacterium]|nr:hemolysin family protein [bacterium]